MVGDYRQATLRRMSTRVIELGNAAARVLSGGALRLDGGAMFGIIPKPIWSRSAPPDDANRIALACNCLLIEGALVGGRRVLIETGHGSKFGEKERSIFGIDPGRWLLPALAAEGVEPETITDVILTHLHFDHAGGLTRESDGQVDPTFPRAAVHVARAEFDDARANFGIMTNSYREENFEPVDRAAAWRLHAGAGGIIDGIEALPTPGHTRGHCSIVIRGADRTLAFVGDVLPTARHAGRPYNMGYDLYPLENRQSKQRLFMQAEKERWTLVLGHEPETPVVHAVAEKGWYRLDAAE